MEGSKVKKAKSCGFQSLGLSANVLRGVLLMGYKVPTPVQRKSLPVSLTGVDSVVMARTGSGKTAAFLIPVIEKLGEHSSKVGVRAIILSPSRELALQTQTFAQKMARHTGLRFALLVGGDSMDKQFEALANNPDVIIATPGRLMHHLQEVPDFTLKCVEVVVFDEADRLFEMGFAEQLRAITKTVPERRQTLLFSATMPKQLVQFARAGLQDPVLIRLDTDHKVSENLSLAFLTCRSTDKPACLMFLLREIIPEDQMTVIFTATRHHAELLHALLIESNMKSSIIYGAMDQEARKLNLENFRRGHVKLLLVTDLAARGIDVPLLDNVINYSFPPLPKLFVHRVGRAARQGRRGAALSLVEPEEKPYMMDLHLFLGRPVTCAELDHPGYTLPDMGTEDVHTGCFLQQILDEENDSLRVLQNSKESIQALVKVADNAMKQYRRTRPDPSRRAIERAKTLSVNLEIHPLLKKFAARGMTSTSDAASRAEYLKAMAAFRPRETIFEALGGGTSVVRLREKIMGNLRQERRVHTLLERASAYGIEDVDTKKPEIEEEEETNDTTLLETDDFMHIDTDTDELLLELQEKDDEHTNINNIKSNNKSEKVVEKVRQDPFTAKRRMSQAERKAKKLKTEDGSQSNCSSTGDKNGTKKRSRTRQEDTHEEEVEVAEKGSGKFFAPGKFADPSNFIGYGVTEASTYVEGSMQPRSVERAADGFATDRLAEAMLDVNPDEAVEMAKKQRLLHWDQKKRKFIKTSLQEMSDNKGRTVRNEAGVIVTLRKEKVGAIYNKWAKKTKRAVGKEGEEEVARPSRRNSKGAAPILDDTTSRGARVKDELKSGQQIKKDRVKHSFKKMASLPKAERAAALKKSKAAFDKKRSEKRAANFKGHTRSRVIIRK